MIYRFIAHHKNGGNGAIKPVQICQSRAIQTE